MQPHRQPSPRGPRLGNKQQINGSAVERDELINSLQGSFSLSPSPQPQTVPIFHSVSHRLLAKHPPHTEATGAIACVFPAPRRAEVTACAHGGCVCGRRGCLSESRATQSSQAFSGESANVSAPWLISFNYPGWNRGTQQRASDSSICAGPSLLIIAHLWTIYIPFIGGDILVSYINEDVFLS